MILYIKSLLMHIGAIGIIAGAIFFLASSYGNRSQEIFAQKAATSTIQTIIPQIITEPLPPIEKVATTKNATPEPHIPVSQPTPPPSLPSEEEDASANDVITRIKDPYLFPPYSFDIVNTEARSALVNILCLTTVKGIRPITASGILIDPRGIILTNAHVAQYVLLSQSSQVNVTCTIRHGSPARSLWKPEILYIPPVWVEKHAEDITKERSTGTGEHDYALLRITSTVDGSILPASFPALPPDTREGIGFLDDPILAASYPAEFLASGSAEFELYPLSSISKIRELLTFSSGTIDLISIGGTAGAQGGSSGGAIVNAWGRLVGLITTTSEGATTAERDLRGLTLSYIDRDLVTQTGSNLSGILSGNVVAKATDFNTNKAPPLIELLITQIANHTN